MESPTFDGFSEPCFYQTDIVDKGIEQVRETVQKELQSFISLPHFQSTVRDIVMNQFEVCQHPSTPAWCCSPASPSTPQKKKKENKYAVTYFPSFNADYSTEEQQSDCCPDTFDV